jgi:hypothetical protein
MRGLALIEQVAIETHIGNEQLFVFKRPSIAIDHGNLPEILTR